MFQGEVKLRGAHERLHPEVQMREVPLRGASERCTLEVNLRGVNERRRWELTKSSAKGRETSARCN